MLLRSGRSGGAIDLRARTNMRRRLFRSGGMAVVQICWTTLVMFIVYRTVTHQFGFSILGVWATAIAFASLVSLFDIGISDIMVRQIAGALGRADPAHARGLHMVLTAGSVIGLLMGSIAIAPFMISYLQASAPLALRSAVPTIVGGALFVGSFNVLSVGQGGVLEALGRYDLKLGISFVSGLAVLGITYWCMQSETASDISYIFTTGSVITVLLTFVVAHYHLLRLSPHVRRLSMSELCSIIRIAAPTRVASILTLGLDPVTRGLMIRYADVESSAVYEIAYRVIFQLRSALVAGLQTIVPYLSRLNASYDEDRNNIVLSAGVFAVSIATPLMVLAVMGMPIISEVILGKNPASIGIYASLLAIAWLVNIASAPGYFANLAIGQVHRNWISQAVACTCNVLLAPSFAVLWHGIGVCAAYAAAILAGAIATLLGRATESRMLLRLIMLDFGVFAAGVLSVVLTGLLWRLLPVGPKLITWNIVFMGIYCAVAASSVVRAIRFRGTAYLESAIINRGA